MSDIIVAHTFFFFSFLWGQCLLKAWQIVHLVDFCCLENHITLSMSTLMSIISEMQSRNIPGRPKNAFRQSPWLFALPSPSRRSFLFSKEGNPNKRNVHNETCLHVLCQGPLILLLPEGALSPRLARPQRDEQRRADCLQVRPTSIPIKKTATEPHFELCRFAR